MHVQAQMRRPSLCHVRSDPLVWSALRVPLVLHLQRVMMTATAAAKMLSCCLGGVHAVVVAVGMLRARQDVGCGMLHLLVDMQRRIVTRTMKGVRVLLQSHALQQLACVHARLTSAQLPTRAVVAEISLCLAEVEELLLLAGAGPMTTMTTMMRKTTMTLKEKVTAMVVVVVVVARMMTVKKAEVVMTVEAGMVIVVVVGAIRDVCGGEGMTTAPRDANVHYIAAVVVLVLVLVVASVHHQSRSLSTSMRLTRRLCRRALWSAPHGRSASGVRVLY